MELLKLLSTFSAAHDAMAADADWRWMSEAGVKDSIFSNAFALLPPEFTYCFFSHLRQDIKDDVMGRRSVMRYREVHGFTVEELEGCLALLDQALTLLRSNDLFTAGQRGAPSLYTVQIQEEPAFFQPEEAGAFADTDQQNKEDFEPSSSNSVAVASAAAAASFSSESFDRAQCPQCKETYSGLLPIAPQLPAKNSKKRLAQSMASSSSSTTTTKARRGSSHTKLTTATAANANDCPLDGIYAVSSASFDSSVPMLLPNGQQLSVCWYSRRLWLDLDPLMDYLRSKPDGHDTLGDFNTSTTLIQRYRQKFETKIRLPPAANAANKSKAAAAAAAAAATTTGRHTRASVAAASAPMDESKSDADDEGAPFIRKFHVYNLLPEVRWVDDRFLITAHLLVQIMQHLEHLAEAKRTANLKRFCSILEQRAKGVINRETKINATRRLTNENRGH